MLAVTALKNVLATVNKESYQYPFSLQKMNSEKHLKNNALLIRCDLSLHFVRIKFALESQDANTGAFSVTCFFTHIRR